MPVPVWIPGQVLVSADVNAWFVPVAAVKGSDQSVTSSTALVNDSALFVPAAANATYWVEAFIDYEGGTQGSSDIKVSWAVPSGATLRYVASFVGTNGNLQGAAVRAGGATFGAGTNGGGSQFAVWCYGTLVMSSTAGNLQFQWAQNTSNATATTVHAQSCVTMWRLS